MPDLFTHVTSEAARRFGDRPAFVSASGRPLGFVDLHRIAGETAAGLRSRGVGPGDVIALVLPSTVEYVVAYLAAARLGAVTTGVNPRLAGPERRRIVESAGADLVLTTDALENGLAAVAPTEVVVAGAAPDEVLASLRRTDVPGPVEANPGRPVAIVWTSGTTGEPKGAVFGEAQLRAVVEADWGRWGGGGPMLASTQFAHVGFMTKLPWYLMSGSTMHLLDRWRARDALELVSRHRMASIGGVAPQVALMLQVPDFDDFDLSSVTTIVMGGGPSPPALVEEARRRFDAAYSIRYSSTESGGIGTATAFDADDDEALFTVGRPRPGVDVEIRDEAGHTVETGGVGELYLRSPTMMTEYWNDPDATAATLRDGWLRTGDLAAVDEKGLVRLAGRRKEIYIRGGYNVYPMEVESVLASHPDVGEIAVVPRPDDVMGEIGVAVVVPRPGAEPDLERLRTFARDRLASYKLPEALRVVDDLPRTPMHKVDRRLLAEREQAFPQGADAP